MQQRIKELDLLKTFTLLVSLAGIHTLYDLTTLDVDNYVLTRCVNILSGTFGAPLFMVCMGITLGYSRHQEVKDWLRRGAELITIGMALNILRWGTLAIDAYLTNQPELYKGLAQIYNVDIMQFAGLAFMLMAALKKIKAKDWQILLLSIGMNIVGSLLEGVVTPYYAVNQLLGYFYPTPTCCCFPLLNWFIFVAAGNMIGHGYRSTNDMRKRYRFALLVGGAVTAVYLYLTIVVQLPQLRTLQGDWGLYWMNPYDAIPTALCIAPFSIAVMWLIGKAIPDRWMEVISYPSRNINQFYGISWVWIMWLAHVFVFIPKATTLGGYIGMWIGIIGITIGTMVVYNRYLKDRWAPWFSRHATAWAISIWTILIAFGIWYFTNVEGPYITPY